MNNNININFVNIAKKSFSKKAWQSWQSWLWELLIHSQHFLPVQNVTPKTRFLCCY